MWTYPHYHPITHLTHILPPLYFTNDTWIEYFYFLIHLHQKFYFYLIKIRKLLLIFPQHLEKLAKLRTQRREGKRKVDFTITDPKRKNSSKPLTTSLPPLSWQQHRLFNLHPCRCQPPSATVSPPGLNHHLTLVSCCSLLREWID